MSVSGEMFGEPSGLKGKAKLFQQPTYAHLIHDAITSLRQRGGSSALAIKKTIEDKMGPTLQSNYKKVVGSTLSKMAKTGKLIKTGNTFKLSPNFKQEFRRRRRHRGRKKGRRRRRRRRRGRRRRRRRGRKGRGRRHRRRRSRKHKRRRRRRRRRRSKSPKSHHHKKRRALSRSPSAPKQRSRSGEKKPQHTSYVNIHPTTNSSPNASRKSSP